MKALLIALSLVCVAAADTSRDLNADAKAISEDKSVDRVSIAGTWVVDSEPKATLVLFTDGTFRLEGARRSEAGIWFAGSGGRVVLRFKDGESVDRYVVLQLQNGALVDDQVCYKVTYAKK